MVCGPSVRISRAPTYSGTRYGRSRLRLRGFHPLRPAFPGRSPDARESHVAGPNTGSLRFGLLRFRSPLLTESITLSSPPGTKMFQFPGCIPAGANAGRWPPVKAAGFPHSEIGGSKLTSSSPPLIAGSRVLHRLLVPRHPLCALINLTSAS